MGTGWESDMNNNLIPLSSNNTHRALTPPPLLQMGKLRHVLKNKIQENTVVTPSLAVAIAGPWTFQGQWAGSSCFAPWLAGPGSNQARRPQLTYKSSASASGLTHTRSCFLRQMREHCKRKHQTLAHWSTLSPSRVWEPHNPCKSAP